MPYDPLKNPVDYIVLANRKSPGRATVTGAGSPRMWDKRKGYALSGARQIYKGNDLSPFTVTLEIISSEEWAEWHEWKEIVNRVPAGSRAHAMDIWHPILEDLGINACVVNDVTQPMEVDDKGTYQVVIQFTEYRPPVRIVAEVEGSAEVDDPPSREEIVINQLTSNLRAFADTERRLIEQAQE